ncbi:MAG TPA: hypothetical protein VND96_14105 [Candidatus Micrarchaeaceae archaeon]|nr:hypothetical protein [Candidatus Micrarchaeaceae archaeon]
MKFSIAALGTRFEGRVSGTDVIAGRINTSELLVRSSKAADATEQILNRDA